ncbi:MAG: RNA polymerase subunit sigma-70 [Clostridia bacterium]|nr:RNA polymerase subunit sigma-70 [Clostridia bacterium]
MEWNNGSEWRKFQREQEKLHKEYLAAGMTEEQYDSMYEFDLAAFKLSRTEARHTQRLDIETSEDEDRYMENPLYKKFLDKLAVRDKYADHSRYGWVNDIQDERLYKAVMKLSEADLELLTQNIVIGIPQNQLAENYGISTVAIHKKLKRIKNFLKKFLV